MACRLIAFNVVNTRNSCVAAVANFLYGITEPVLLRRSQDAAEPRRIAISPIILILIIHVISGGHHLLHLSERYSDRRDGRLALLGPVVSAFCVARDPEGGRDEDRRLEKRGKWPPTVVRKCRVGRHRRRRPEANSCGRSD